MIDKWAETMPQVTDDEKSKLRDEVDKVVTWLDDKEAAQKLKSKYVNHTYFKKITK